MVKISAKKALGHIPTLRKKVKFFIGVNLTYNLLREKEKDQVIAILRLLEKAVANLDFTGEVDATVEKSDVYVRTNSGLVL